LSSSILAISCSGLIHTNMHLKTTVVFSTIPVDVACTYAQPSCFCCRHLYPTLINPCDDRHAMPFALSECQDFCHGLRSAVSGHAICITVRLPLLMHHAHVQSLRSFNLLMCVRAVRAHLNLARDPTQHASLKAEIEAQSSSLYATARLWDDGIIKPTETRDVVGLGLALAAGQRGSTTSSAGSDLSGRGFGFGVYRM
jgi:hypothetical protein